MEILIPFGDSWPPAPIPFADRFATTSRRPHRAAFLAMDGPYLEVRVLVFADFKIAGETEWTA